MKYKNQTDKDLMVCFPPRAGRATEWACVKAGEEKELDMTEDRATTQGLIVAGRTKVAPEAEESKVSGGPEGSVKVETKKAKGSKKGNKVN